MKKSKELDYPLLTFFGIIFFIIYIVFYTNGVTDKYGAVPQILLSATVFMGMFFGDKVGAIFGFLIGSALDAVSTNTTCFNSITCLLLGYFCGVAITLIINNNFKASLIMVLLVSLIYNVLKSIFGVVSFDYLLNQMPYTVFLTVIFSIPLYWGIYLIVFLRKKQLLKRNWQEWRLKNYEVIKKS